MDASAWDERYAATELVWGGGPNQFVESELSGLRAGRAVDLAAGEGRNAIWLAGRGWQVTAVDFSQVALDKGRRLAAGTLGAAASNIEWVRADVLQWRGADHDLAVLAYLQVSADERRQVLRNAFDSLVPGGTLFVVAHDSTNLTEGTGGPQDATVLYTADDVLTDLADESVEVVRAERVARRVPAPDGHGAEGVAWDALARLRRVG